MRRGQHGRCVRRQSGRRRGNDLFRRARVEEEQGGRHRADGRSQRSDGGDRGAELRSTRDRLKKNSSIDRPQRGDRLGRIDRDAQVGSVVDALRVPGVQRAQLVDDPAVVTARGARRRSGRSAPAGRDVPEALGLVGAFVQQQLDVVEQELPALLAVEISRGVSPRASAAACSKIHGLRSAPRPTSTPRYRARRPAGRRAASGSTQSPLPKTGMPDAIGDPRDQIPVGHRRCRTAPRSARARRPPRRRRLPCAAPAPAR